MANGERRMVIGRLTGGLGGVLLLLVMGCEGAGQAPPFEWWVDPLPKPPVRQLGRVVQVAVLVDHVGRRDDFNEFRRHVRAQHDRVQSRAIPGFRAECHYLPKLARAVRSEIEERLTASGRFALVERKSLDKALKTSRVQWLDLRHPAVAAEIGRACEAEFVLLVEIVDCTMKVVEAGQQMVGAKRVGPLRQTDVLVTYDLRMVEVASASLWWRSGLVRRAGYKLEGPGSMGHWYRPRDPLEFRKALRGQSVADYVLKALVGDAPATQASKLLPGDPRRWE
jgi:hypothetical protein